MQGLPQLRLVRFPSVRHVVAAVGGLLDSFTSRSANILSTVHYKPLHKPSYKPINLQKPAYHPPPIAPGINNVCVHTVHCMYLISARCSG